MNIRDWKKQNTLRGQKSTVLHWPVAQVETAKAAAVAAGIASSDFARWAVSAEQETPYDPSNTAAETQFVILGVREGHARRSANSAGRTRRARAEAAPVARKTAPVVEAPPAARKAAPAA